jgi:succinyl-CoA synthetase alpha subunit
MKALRLGMDVMVFSDNVSPTAELTIKTYAAQADLMVMGPDCRTSIVNGIPLGFANVVRRGPIGVVGASGTGTQEVTVRIHQGGSGVSQALGTGGHDLAEAIGGISMLHGLAALDDDPGTEVIVLVSNRRCRRWRRRSSLRRQPAPSRWW